MNRRQHWNAIYTHKGERDVGWFEAVPETSLRMLGNAGMTAASCVIDVGGGNSRLVDALMAKGLDCIAVLDVSAAAISRAKERLGTEASIVTWIEADVAADWSLKPMDIWHDRAVFHFLIDPADRSKYVGHLRQVLKVGGSAIVATFDVTGPEKCSGLPVQRYSADALARELGANFQLAESVEHLHHTPWGAAQAFRYSRFTRTS
jgi:SAM-dependent methyltransferase